MGQKSFRLGGGLDSGERGSVWVGDWIQEKEEPAATRERTREESADADGHRDQAS